MSDTHKSTRLGDLLVERGTITRHQLLRAIEAQQERRLKALKKGDIDPPKEELGEILIELGFINRTQLDSSLSWQRKLRKTTLVMAFIAPLLTAACGGGSGSSNSSDNNNPSTTVSSQAFSSADSPAETPSSSAPSISSSSTSSVSSSAPATSSMPSSSSSHAQGIDGPAVIYWSIPTQRENGEHLDITEIGGYELRYRLTSANEFSKITIANGFTDTYYFDYLRGEYVFEIATFDINGLYSKFIEIKPI